MGKKASGVQQRLIENAAVLQRGTQQLEKAVGVIQQLEEAARARCCCVPHSSLVLDVEQKKGCELGQAGEDKLLEVLHLGLATAMHQTLVGFEGVFWHQLLQEAGTQLTHPERNDGIAVSMALQTGHVHRGTTDHLFMDGEPAGQSGDAGQRFARRQRNMKGQSASLRKSTYHDTIGWDSGLDFLLNQTLDQRTSLFNSRLVLRTIHVQGH